MKKFLLITVVLLLTTACSSSYLKKINYNDLQKKLENKDTFVLYLTDESNEGKTLKNNLYAVAKDNKLQTFYLNTEKLNENDTEKPEFDS